jgi:hypothetical protein
MKIAVVSEDYIVVQKEKFSFLVKCTHLYFWKEM